MSVFIVTGNWWYSNPGVAGIYGVFSTEQLSRDFIANYGDPDMQWQITTYTIDNPDSENVIARIDHTS